MENYLKQKAEIGKSDILVGFSNIVLFKRNKKREYCYLVWSLGGAVFVVKASLSQPCALCSNESLCPQEPYVVLSFRTNLISQTHVFFQNQTSANVFVYQD